MCLLARRLKAQNVGKVSSVQYKEIQQLYSCKYIPLSDIFPQNLFNYVPEVIGTEFEGLKIMFSWSNIQLN